MTHYQRLKQIEASIRRDVQRQREHNARMQSNPYWNLLTVLRCAQAAAMYADPQEELERRVQAARSAA